jgi:hypothetical protein
MVRLRGYFWDDRVGYFIEESSSLNSRYRDRGCSLYDAAHGDGDASCPPGVVSVYLGYDYQINRWNARSLSEMTAEYLGQGAWLITVGTTLAEQFWSTHPSYLNTNPPLPGNHPARKSVEEWLVFETAGSVPTQRR